MAPSIVFNPFTAQFDYIGEASIGGGGPDGEKAGVNNINVTAPLTKSGLNTDPILGMDLRTLSELPD